MMTNWIPDLSSGTGPIYMRLADRIEHDINEGVLPPGAKLPPQRNLAFDVGVTIGTVTRAYNLVRERGLVSGEVGRGTFVLDRESAVGSPSRPPVAPASMDGTRIDPNGTARLRMDTTSAPDLGQSVAVKALLDDIARDNPAQIIDYTRDWPASWRDAGRRWLATGDFAPNTETIVPTAGCHAAIMAVIAVATAPGDKVAFEQLTYSSISRSANLIGRRTVTFGNDELGPDPDDFERMCAQQHPKLVFLMPGLQNPTLSVMPDERLHAIVDVARRYNVWIIEDAIYSALLHTRTRTLAELAPERVFHVGGLSKAVAAGVRGGWVVCPPHFAPRVQTAHKMVTGGLPFVLAELAARLVNGGEADRYRGMVRAEIEAREELARRIFAGLDFKSHPNAPYLWMKLPEPWLSGTFKQVAANEGVLVDDEDEYKPGRGEKVFHRIRVSFSMPTSRADVVRGFSTIRRLLDHGSAGYDSYG
jgi:DNA-binding transcriptional MocR family regulator